MDQKRKSDHEVIIDLEREHILNQKTQNEWSICCSKSDRNAIKYMVQVSMGISVMLFCMFRICLSEEGADNSVYFGLLSGTLSYYLEAPTLKKNNDNHII